MLHHRPDVAGTQKAVVARRAAPILRGMPACPTADQVHAADD